MRERKALRRLWGGYVDGKLDVWLGEDARTHAAVFLSQREARELYEDVRRVEIREVGR